MKNPFKTELLSGAIFMALVGGACGMGLECLPPAIAGLEQQGANDFLEGKAAPRFEKSFGEALPAESMSRKLWGQIEYLAFHQGRKGVVVGQDGWLFTDEEFSCPANLARNKAENLAYMKQVQEKLAARDTRLAVVLIPAKARVMADRLEGKNPPDCRRNLYDEARKALEASGIETTNLLAPMTASPLRDTLYLKTDTHWSPAGARLAARAVAETVLWDFGELDLPATHFSSKAGEEKPYSGDLTRYLPGVPLPPDKLTAWTTTPTATLASAGPMTDLFGDAVPPVALVGTSYSANDNWNFAGFLREALAADVLNMAEEGQGPFAVMDKYLDSAAWKNTPPRLLVWEVPERFLLMPHGMAGP